MMEEIGIGEAFVVLFSGVAIGAIFLMSYAAMQISKDFRGVDSSIRDIRLEIQEFIKTDARFNFQSEMLEILAGNLFCTNALLHAFFQSQADEIDELADPTGKKKYKLLLEELHERNLEVAGNIDFYRVLVDPSDEAIEVLVEKRPGHKTFEFIKKLAAASSSESKGRLQAKFGDIVSKYLRIDSSRWTGVKDRKDILS